MQSMHTAPRILTIGSALVDVFIASDQFEISHGDEEIFSTRSRGGKLTVDSFAIFSGGGGGNTAAGFAKLGFEVSCLAELGMDELAELVVSDLRKNGVKINHLIQERKEETGGSVLLVSRDGERTALVHRGAAAMLDPSDIDDQVISRQNWVHLSSLAGRTETVQTIFRACAGHRVGLSWNPGHDELIALAAETDWAERVVDMSDSQGSVGQEPMKWAVTRESSQARESESLLNHPVTILLLNEQEWQLVEPVQEALQRVVEVIVITDSVRGGRVLERKLDDQGRYEATKETIYEAQAVKSVDNTGAGDAFAVGFIAAWLSRGHDAALAAEWGRRNAAATVQKRGAKNGLLSLSEIADDKQSA